MEYKKIYSPEELKELAEWFKQNLDKFPDTISINSGTHVKNVRHTASIFQEIAAKVGHKKMYGGHMRQFFTLREQIIKQWEQEAFEKEIDSIPV